MNVNGMACGIELYLGKDLLIENGELIPIRWREYNDRVKQYHGVSDRKDLIQKRFREKLKSGNLGEIDEMKVLLEHIFGAFKNQLLQVIYLEDQAFFAIIDKVDQYIREKYSVKEDKWISGEEAMKKLRITS